MFCLLSHSRNIRYTQHPDAFTSEAQQMIKFPRINVFAEDTGSNSFPLWSSTREDPTSIIDLNLLQKFACIKSGVKQFL